MTLRDVLVFAMRDFGVEPLPEKRDTWQKAVGELRAIKAASMVWVWSG
jgi:hypothetical protein